MKPTVIFLRGIRDDKTVKVLEFDNDNFKFNVGGSSNLYRFIDSPLFEKKLLTLDSSPSSSINTSDSRVIVNQIADFDTHKIALNKADDMLSQLDDSVSCINRPEKIKLTTRDSISGLLQDVDNLTVPITTRFTPRTPDDIHQAVNNSRLSYPVLIRECGLHGGEKTVLLQSQTDHDKLHVLALDGREYYLTEYTDYAEDAKKLYKKFRLAIVDGKPYLRHLIFSDHWKIHSSSRDFMEKNPEYCSEEEKQLTTFQKDLAPEIQPVIDAIYKTIGLDYFGIDCHIKPDGSMLIFEINAIMNILINNSATPNIWQKPIERINKAVVNMILSRVDQ